MLAQPRLRYAGSPLFSVNFRLHTSKIQTGLTYQEAVRVVEGLFQQSLTIPYEEKTPEEQVAYIHIASLHHNTFGES